MLLYRCKLQKLILVYQMLLSLVSLCLSASRTGTPLQAIHDLNTTGKSDEDFLPDKKNVSTNWLENATVQQSKLTIANRTVQRTPVTMQNVFSNSRSTKKILLEKSSIKFERKKANIRDSLTTTSTKAVREIFSHNVSSTNNQTTINSTSIPHESSGPDCSKFKQKDADTVSQVDSFCYSPSDSLKCYQDPIFCETYHLSGKRELKWPAYGEYTYLSHEHWVKVLQHGGVVFLYHPCANTSLVSQLRRLAESCMHRYVLTPCEKLSAARPIALVSWGCFFLMDDVDFPTCKRWIQLHAYKGPASHIHKNGTYEHQLVRAAKVITDVKDTFLCPDEQEKASLRATKPPALLASIHTKHHIGEEIIMKRLAKAKHQTRTHPRTLQAIPVDRKKAFTAFGSLVFLFILLLIFLLYTKLWVPNFKARKFRYEKLGDLESESEYYQSQFSLLKSGQNFVSSLKRGKKSRKRDAQCKVKLLAPITEEGDDSDYD